MSGLHDGDMMPGPMSGPAGRWANHWPEADVAALCDMDRRGMRRQVMAEKLGRSLSAVDWKLRMLRAKADDAGLRRGAIRGESWTEGQIKRLTLLWAQGVSARLIAEDLQRSELAVRHQVEKLQLPERTLVVSATKRPWTAEDDAALRAGLERGLTKATIAQQMGRSVHTIYWRAGRVDLPVAARPDPAPDDLAPDDSALDDSGPDAAARQPWPEDWAGRRCDPGEAAEMRRLWAAVALQALRDEADAVARVAADPDRQAELVGRGWLRGRDGAQVLSLAGFDPAAVRDRVVAMVRRSGVRGLREALSSALWSRRRPGKEVPG